MTIPEELTAETGEAFLHALEDEGLEMAHVYADQVLVAVLRKLNYTELVIAYEAIPKRYA